MAGEMPGTSPYSYAYGNPVLLKDPDGELPIIPFLIKAGAAGASDRLLQVGMNYLLDDDVETLGQALHKVDWVEVGISSAQGALPWSVPGRKYGKAAAAATGDVFINAGKASISGEDYTIDDAAADFFVGFISQLGAEQAGELLSSKKSQEKLGKLLGGRYDELAIKQGLEERHHIPANSVSPLTKERGPAVIMDKKDHRRTASWGNSREAQDYRSKQKEMINRGNFEGAMDMDAQDVRSKF